MTTERRRLPTWVIAIALAVILLASMTIAVAVGPADISPADVFWSVLHHLGIGSTPLGPLQDGIVWQLRMPRVLTACAVGAGLAISGVVMQALTRNPLADPYLLGLSSGASFGAVSVLLLGIGLLLPVAAFIGAFVALLASFALAGAYGRIQPSRLILAGIAVSALFAALTSFVIFWLVTGDSYREILNWLLGSLAGSSWMTVIISFAGVLIIGVPMMTSGRVLDVFSLGDDTAAALGASVNRSRWLLLVGTALLTGAMVSVSGSIGFVGLILPHMVRLLGVTRHTSLLPLSALAGAIYLLWADTIARTLFDPRELPVGIVTALIGAPVFAVLLVRQRRIG